MADRTLTRMEPKEAYDAYSRLAYYENSDYIIWRKQSLGLREFYFGNQWTEEDKATNAERGQYTLTVNRMRKAINGMVGMVTANMPEFKCVPVGTEDTATAELASKILKVVWNNSNGLNTWRKAVMQGVRDNLGWIHVKQDDRNNTTFVNVPLERVMVDPKSTDSLFRDAEYIYHIKWIPLDAASRLYGINPSEFSTSTPDTWDTFRSASDDTINPHPAISADKLYVKVSEGYKRVVENVYDENKRWTGETTVKMIKETIIGYEHVFTEELPEQITEYPWIPIYSEDTENPLKLGEGHFLMEYQKIINKSFGIMMLNAQLASNPKVFVWEDTIPDDNMDKFEDSYARAGSVNVLAGDGKDGQAPIIIGGQPINSAWFDMLKMLLNLFEQASLPAQVLGHKDSNDKQHSSHILEQKEAVMDSLKLMLGHIDAGLQQLGKVVLQYTKAYAGTDKILRIVNAGKIEEELRLNQQKGLNPDDPATVNAYMSQRTQEGVSIYEVQNEITKAKESMNTAKAINVIINDTSSLDVDVFVVPGSYAPSYSMAKYAVKKELFQMQAVDNEALLEDAPLENKDTIIARVSQNKQLLSANAALGHEIEKMQGTITTLNEAIAKGKIDNITISHDGKMDKLYT